MAYLTAATVMTSSVLEGYSPIAILFKCEISYLWHVAQSLFICRASCTSLRSTAHTTILQLSGLCPGQPRWAGTRSIAFLANQLSNAVIWEHMDNWMFVY